MADKYKELAKNTIYLTISQFGTKVLQFLLVPFYTYVLSTSDYGEVDIINTTITLVGYLFTLNIADAVLRFVIEKRQNARDILKFGQMIIFAGTLLLSLFAVVIYSSGLLSWPFYYYSFIIYGFFTDSISGLYSRYLKAINKVGKVAFAGVLNTLIIISCNLLFLLVFKLGVVGYLLSNIIGNTIMLIFCYFNIGEKDQVNSIKCEPGLKKEMLFYSVPLIFNGLAWWVNSSLDKYFILYFYNTSENGIYGASSKIPLILSTVLSIFIQAWSLSAIKEFDKDDKEGFFSNIYNVVCSVLLCTCSVLVFLNIFLISTFQSAYFIGWKSASILLISGIFNGMSSFLASFFSAAKNSKMIAYTTVVAAVVNLVLNFLLIPKYGIQGAAVATALSFFTMWLMRWIKLRKIITLKTDNIRFLICFILILTQVAFERLPNHFYIGQGIIVLVILGLNYKRLILAASKILSKYIKRGKHEKV